jgi:hypothetical protein
MTDCHLGERLQKGARQAIALCRVLPHLPGWTTTLMMTASVLTIVPLPSRHFAHAFAIAVLLGGSFTNRSEERPSVTTAGGNNVTSPATPSCAGELSR